ncbi:hypothetical protein MFIFM68171_10678 [Madurella fahalii]|uniref:Uncharacterized protein n=1 Tax=Madurella fahalii TaxID=1157608 RepID=A0ABQ0GRV4_9PEZI
MEATTAGPSCVSTLPPLSVARDASLPAEARSSPPQSEGSDDGYDVDQDDAQSFMQPAISALATLLTSPRTPAADKAAVLDRQTGDELFERLENGPPSHALPNDGVIRQRRQTESAAPEAAAAGHQPPVTRFPTPWQAGPKQFLITEPERLKPTEAAVPESRSRHQRSLSVGESALRRLSKALPSISIPTGFIPNIPTPNFFSSSSNSPPKSGRPSPPRTPVTPSITKTSAGESFPDFVSPPHRTLRQTTSDDSLLYHTLSRVSSLGDDERFAHVREQVNVRIKAIKDSFDGPSFKLPQMPSILNQPLKRPAAEPRSDAHRSGLVSNGLRAQDPLDAILESLTGDIVIMGGYRGSILRSAKAPHRRLWVPVKVQLGVRKVNLEVGLDPEDEEDMENHIIADGMLKNIGPVDVSKRLFKKLRECENARTGKLRVHDYGYDWRLSPHRLSRKLVEFLEKLPSNQPDTPKEQRGALVIAHSLGGLITRHAVNQRPDLFSGVLYAGVPQRCVNVLGPLRNGDAVLLNEKLLTAQVNFSLRTTFVFLPEDGFCFVDKVTKEEYKVDFYNVDDWIKYRFCPCVSGPALPALSRSSTFGSLLSLSDSLPSLPLRSRSNGQTHKKGVIAEATHSITKDRTLAPQMGSSGSSSDPSSSRAGGNSCGTPDAVRARNIAYLARTLAETKRFRAELAHRPSHQEANAYPPLAVIYAKDIPTTYAASVAGREGIACADAYDDLLFRSGDGVVLAREAMLPPGYELVRDGRICTDRGHITMLGDLSAVGRALAALVRGRGKGIGLGVDAGVVAKRG